MPDDRTFITELTTALGMLGGTEVMTSVRSRPRALSLSADDWSRLDRLIAEGSRGAEAGAAFENGRAFLESPDALRGRRPMLIEWTGGRRPPGDEVAPIDLRIDHVFLVSCKYLSANIANPSPARLFDGLLTTSGDWARGDWYMETAPAELTRLYLECKHAAGLEDLPDDPAELELADRRRLRLALPPRVFPPEAQGAYRALCTAVSNASARRWTEAIDRYGNPEQVLWRLLRIGNAQYYLLGADSRRPLRLRIASPWDWRQQFRFLRLEVSPSAAGQPQVDWVGTYEDLTSRRRAEVRGHVEVRWSHGRFVHPPEAKVYLDTPTDELPGYYQLAGRSPRAGRSKSAGEQSRLFDDPGRVP
jgi:hypothetical protein